MEKLIRERYSEAILAAARERYGLGADEARLLDGFESFIYDCGRGADHFILRLAHSRRLSAALIRGEVDWINHLAAAGVPVARALPSERGHLVEAVDDGQGGQFLATAFVKAEGQPPGKLWSPALYAAYGQLLGRMHALAVDYEPAQAAWRRPEWDDPIFEFVERYLPASAAAAKEKYRALCGYLRALPHDRQAYGLIHQDAHGGNFLVDGAGRLTLFDFDECGYSWYANDVAIALFYIAQNAADAPAFTREFMPPFLRGYRSVRPLSRSWLRELPAFLKLREIELYAVIHRDFDVENITDAWCARFMQGRKDKIEHDVPFIDFDFESLADEA